MASAGRLGGPRPALPTAPPQGGASPGEELGGTRCKIVQQTADAGLSDDFSEGSPEFFTGAGASLRGCRGHFRKGSPQTPGIREEGSPGTGDSQGVSTPLCLKASPSNPHM